jgi:hypothetical protein
MHHITRRSSGDGMFLVLDVRSFEGRKERKNKGKNEGKNDVKERREITT